MVGIQLHAKIGEKGQLVIPQPIRKQLNIQPETELVFNVEEDKIIIAKKKNSLAVLEEFTTAIKDKKSLKNRDWDKEYYSQLKGYKREN